MLINSFSPHVTEEYQIAPHYQETSFEFYKSNVISEIVLLFID
jgi:hypothetical protein